MSTPKISSETSNGSTNAPKITLGFRKDVSKENIFDHLDFTVAGYDDLSETEIEQISIMRPDF